MTVPFRHPRLSLLPLLLAAALLALAGCGVDSDQALLCRKLIPAFEPHPERVRVDSVDAAADDPRALIIRYHAGEEGHWLRCRFAGRYFDADRHELAGVATDATGPLGAMQLTMLRLWAGLPQPRPSGADTGGDGDAAAAGALPAGWKPALFLAQQVINAATVGCVYGLLAIGYTLVFGILGQINLAMGELTMLGAMMTAMAAAGLGMLGVQGAAAPLLAVLAAVMLVTAGHGWLMDRAVFRHLRNVRSHTPLIAAVGLSIAYQEGMRLLHGARDWWPAPVFATRHTLATAGTFTVTALTSQALIVALTGLLYGALWWLIQRSPWGRAHRACADDVKAAALMGVNVNRTVAMSFAVGGAYAAAAGYVIALYYGGVSFFTGYLVGFKALTAAVIGGIGSVPGAMLGSAVLGVFEIFWSGYFSIAYKDVVAFALLAVFLIFRPHGLLGQARARGD